MHAQNQSLIVAKNLLGSREPYRQVSHMWSDQYDLKIQVAGAGDTPDSVLRGTLESNKFLMFHLGGGKIVGATSINEPICLRMIRLSFTTKALPGPGRCAAAGFPRNRWRRAGALVQDSIHGKGGGI